MKIVTLDFETYYNTKAGYTLKKMTPVEYALDPQFEAIGCAVKEDRYAQTYWIEGPDLPRYFAQADKNAGYLSHNALFDMSVSSWVYDFRPRLMIDSMGIARAALGHALTSVSLKSVAAYLGLPAKGDTVNNVNGMCRAAIVAQPALYESYKAYSCHDADLCMGVFDELVRKRKLFPVGELPVMDMVLRCALQPRFRLDQMVLAEHLNEVKATKRDLLARAGLQPDENGKCASLMSNDQFATLLEDLGVDPPRKISLKTNEETWAFAKSDPQFIELSDHENPEVQALVGARLGHKSTLEETRTERLLKIAQLHWGSRGAASYMPVPLRFSGAIQTHRLSGDWKLNMQNMPRNTPVKVSQLRRALTAGPDEVVVVGDESQIEARIVAWICNQLELLEQFERGDDVYSLFATEVFGHPVNRKLPDQQNQGEGFIGKTGILGLGFGVGWLKFQKTVKVDSRKFTGREIILTDEEAHNVVHTYRVKKYPEIPAAWKSLNNEGIAALAGRGDYKIGPCEFEKETIHLPNGLRLHYHNLQHTEQGWMFQSGHKRKKIYGGALLENIVQALARIVTMDAGVRIQRRAAAHNIWLNLQGHDELAYVVLREQAEAHKALVLEEMAVRPWWAKDLPLKAEADIGETYGDAK